MTDELPTTLWALFHDRGHADEFYLWTAPPHCTPDDGRVLLVFTTRERAEDYADSFEDERIVAREVETRRIPAMVGQGKGQGDDVTDAGIDYGTVDSWFMPWDEFEERAREVPVVIGT